LSQSEEVKTRLRTILAAVILAIGAVAHAGLAPGDAFPVVLKQVPPVDPRPNAKVRIHTEVVVEFVVEKDGTVQIAKVVSQSERPYRTAALEAVKKWTFKPGLKAGVPVRCLMKVPIVFE
jgi:TonB family protein